MVLAFSVIGFAKAQEITGPAAEKTKKEVLKLEDEWVTASLKSNDAAAEYYESNDADGLVLMTNGQLLTKAQRVKAARTALMKIVSLKEEDVKVHVYDNGNLAVVTAKHIQDFDLNGKVTSNPTVAVTVYVKQNGTWRSVVHAVHRTSE